MYNIDINKKGNKISVVVYKYKFLIFKDITDSLITSSEIDALHFISDKIKKLDIDCDNINDKTKILIK